MNKLSLFALMFALTMPMYAQEIEITEDSNQPEQTEIVDEMIPSQVNVMQSMEMEPAIGPAEEMPMPMPEPTIEIEETQTVEPTMESMPMPESIMEVEETQTVESTMESMPMSEPTIEIEETQTVEESTEEEMVF